MIRGRFTVLVLGLGLFLFYATSYALLQQQQQQQQQQESRLLRNNFDGIWNLPPIILLALAGEHKGLLADYLTLEAGARLGTQLVRNPAGGFQVVEKEHEWSTIYHIFQASQILDPAFAQTFLLAQGWLPWDADMVEETNELLRTAHVNRLWDWQPLHMIGFNTYYFQEQPGEAGKIFMEAAKRPHAPSFLAIVGSRLALKGGETEAATVLMKSMLADKSSSEPGYDDMMNRYQALEGVLTLEKGVAWFQQSHGRIPADVQELLAAGAIAKIPDNPYDLAYCIDSGGKVFFDNPHCRSN